MRARMVAFLAIAIAPIGTGEARAQCANWLPPLLFEETSNWVGAFANFRGRLVVAGSFNPTAAPYPVANNILGWDGVSFSSFSSGMDDAVLSLYSFKYPGASGDFELIAGGDFDQAGGVAANRIARWVEDPVIAFPPPAWAPMGAGFNNAPLAIERYSGATYAGGRFTASGATPLSRIARWNETSDVWESVGGGVSGGVNGYVWTMQIYDGNLYVGGDFTSAGGVSTGGLARWNGSSWSAVGGFFNGIVYSLEVHNGVLVIGGGFPGFGGSPNLSSWNGSFYVNLTPGGADNAVLALFSTGSRLYAGGLFHDIGGAGPLNPVYFDGSSWHDIEAGGVDKEVIAFMPYGNEMNFGGSSNLAGGPDWFQIADWQRYSESGAPWYASQPSSQTVSFGGTATFTAIPADGYSGVSQRWHHNGTPLMDGPTGTGTIVSGATTNTLTLSNVSNVDYGNYHQTATTTCGTAASASALLSFPPATDVPIGGPWRTELGMISPNPAQGPSDLTFSLAREGEVRVRVHDIGGRAIRLLDLGPLSAGRHRAAWDARGNDGLAVSDGLYFIRLEVDGRMVGTRRLAVTR